MAFDITSVLKGVPGPDTGKEQIEYIPVDQIDPDPNNFYSLEGLDELAGNIELIGLQQPLRVRPGEDGRFIVVSGHRRRAAILLIRDGGNEMFRDGVPCIVDRGEESPAMRELRLIYANASTRVMGPAEISKQAERTEMLLYQLKEEGVVEFPGRKRDHVAEACTYQLSRLPSQAQAGVETCLMTGKKKQLPSAYPIEAVVRNLDAYTKPASCRSHAGGPPCTITNVHICRSIWEPYRDCKNLTPNTNGDGICCRDCNDRNSCSWACQECKDRRKLDAAVENEKAAEREKAEAARKELQQKQYRKERQEQAQRIRRLTDELGLIDECPLPSQYSWNKDMTVKEIERIAEGRFGDDHYYNGDLLPTDTSTLVKWAEFLECSTDYLLGRAEDPAPASERKTCPDPDTVRKWGTGDPKDPGLYVVIAGYPPKEADNNSMRAIKFWDGGGWYNERTHAPFDLTVYRWYQLPEV